MTTPTGEPNPWAGFNDRVLDAARKRLREWSAVYGKIKLLPNAEEFMSTLDKLVPYHAEDKAREEAREAVEGMDITTVQWEQNGYGYPLGNTTAHLVTQQENHEFVRGHLAHMADIADKYSFLSDQLLTPEQVPPGFDYVWNNFYAEDGSSQFRYRHTITRILRDPMLDKFTDRARKVMQLANQEAQRCNHEFVGTQHVLLAVLKEGSGIGCVALKNVWQEACPSSLWSGDTEMARQHMIAQLRHECAKVTANGPATDGMIMGKLEFTQGTKDALHRAAAAAENYGHKYVGTEHILLGLLSGDDMSPALKVLRSLGIKLVPLEAEVHRLLEPANLAKIVEEKTAKLASAYGVNIKKSDLEYEVMADPGEAVVDSGGLTPGRHLAGAEGYGIPAHGAVYEGSPAADVLGWIGGDHPAGPEEDDEDEDSELDKAKFGDGEKNCPADLFTQHNAVFRRPAVHHEVHAERIRAALTLAAELKDVHGRITRCAPELQKAAELYLMREFTGYEWDGNKPNFGMPAENG